MYHIYTQGFGLSSHLKDFCRVCKELDSREILGQDYTTLLYSKDLKLDLFACIIYTHRALVYHLIWRTFVESAKNLTPEKSWGRRVEHSTQWSPIHMVTMLHHTCLLRVSALGLHHQLSSWWGGGGGGGGNLHIISCRKKKETKSVFCFKSSYLLDFSSKLYI